MTRNARTRGPGDEEVQDDDGTPDITFDDDEPYDPEPDDICDDDHGD